METIWKYTLEPADMQNIELPMDSQVLTVQNQNEKICMWVKLDPSKPKVNRAFAVFGTGWVIVSSGKFNFIGTVQLSNGKLVFHVFEWV